MVLILELHGDLPDNFPTNERRLYLFGCPRKPCNRKPGSIRAYRSTRKVNLDTTPQEEPKSQQGAQPEKEIPQQLKQDLGASLFGATSLTGSVSANANPFSTKPGASSTGENPFATPKPASSSTSANGLAESFADKVRLSSPEPESNVMKSTPPGAATKKTPESTGPLAPWPSQSDFPAPYKNFYLVLSVLMDET